LLRRPRPTKFPSPQPRPLVPKSASKGPPRGNETAVVARTIPFVDYHGLPGAELVLPGIEDLRHGVESVPALLVAIGRPRLSRLALDLPPNTFDEPEHRLYALLAAEHGDAAHSRYNALLRRLVSFERAACAS
jgi:hypothetical protein